MQYEELELSSHEKMLLSSVFLKLPKACSEYQMLKCIKDYESALTSGLSPSLLSRIKKFKQSENQVILVIRGFPCELVHVASPCYPPVDNLLVPMLMQINLAIYQFLEIYPIAYLGENGGSLFRHVSPRRNAASDKTSYGSKLSLGMHIDNCFMPLTPELQVGHHSCCPEFLSLFGVKSDSLVPTELVILDEVLKKLDADTLKVLMEDQFLVRAPDSFDSKYEYTLPIFLKDSRGIYYSRYDHDFIKPTSERAVQAQRALETTLELTKRIDVVLDPGDFLIFKNQRTFHGRKSFLPKFDGLDRWMLRLFGVNDLTRVLPTDKENFYP